MSRLNWKVAIAAAVVLGVAGCTTSQDQDAAPARVTTGVSMSSSTPTTTTTTVSVFDALQAYLHSEERATRITTAAHDFGVVVLQEMRTKGSPWGPFDNFCTKPGDPSAEGKWTSQHYQPVVGDRCAVQHVPSYGGRNIQISADVLVSAGGYSEEFTNAVVSTPECVTSVDIANANMISTSVGEASDLKSSLTADTADEARIIDDQAIKCLTDTRP